ncbi:MAG: hypothetical protein A2804_01105 [Candidatus Pacebacteria bacterium RIFCSPHIGHO2_01_FULL_46_10]|nr:MAG: hypothetical protein A2804_01105 [Candidatus Pacebacteria bacterium RIFCSPHIGHO2_01_FULL_46_10]
MSKLSSLIKRKDLLYILVFGLLAATVWIGFGVYFSFHKNTLTPNVKQQILPLSPIIDTQSLEDLKKRRIFSIDELVSFQVTQEVEEAGKNGGNTTVQAEKSKPSPAPSPTPTAGQTATGSGTTQ